MEETFAVHVYETENVPLTFFFHLIVLFPCLDGVNQFRVSRATGEPLPNPRVISNQISYALGWELKNKKPPDDLANTNFVFFAQFVDHDLANTFPKPITNT